MTASAVPAGQEVAVSFAGQDYVWTEPVPVGADRHAWSHAGATAGRDGALYFGDSSGFIVHELRDDARAAGTRPIDVDATECHGLAITRDGDLWVADPGHKFVADGRGYTGREERGRVTRFGPDGRAVQALQPPPGEGWRPTSVALHAHGSGSDGVIWVADGYGSSLVHAFAADGARLFTTDGADSRIPFRTPHAIIVDDRGDQPTLIVADRGNERLVVLTLDGRFLAAYGEDELTGPSGFAFDGDTLLVTDLYGRLVAFGPDGDFRGATGPKPEARNLPWPNEETDGGIRAMPRRAGRFHAPHGIAVGPGREILVTEWGIGGRVILLTPI